ncbi:MAG: ABC transporter permease [Pseudomonadota bacterium]
MTASVSSLPGSLQPRPERRGPFRPIWLIARKEAGEIVGSTRGRAWLLMLAAALSVFGLLLVSNTELSLLDNAQVVYDMTGIVVALGALLAVIVGNDAIAGERERGSLVPLMLTPVRRSGILAGKLGGQAIAWAVMSALALPYLWAVGSTGQNLADGIVGLVLLGTPVVLGFGFLSMGLGAQMSSARASLSISTVALLLSASPLLLGPSLRQSAVGRAFDAVNPFSNALNAFDGMIIDSQGLPAQWIHGAAVLAWLGATLWYASRTFRNISR